MSYQVLARKYRPASFDDLVGQDHVVRALTHALDNDRLHHAYLFTGTRGVGKTTIGRILARCLNCEAGVSSRPCGECSICREVGENRFVDLIEVDAASRTRVDDTRELLENAQYLPTRGRYKVYLIDEVHMLSASSFNALLKTLEEPPEHVKFLLATTDPKKVPVTVLSRCLQFQLKNITADRTTDYLAGILDAESIAYEPGALTLIARAARGSLRDALSITDQAIGFGQGSITEDGVVTMLGLVGRDEVGAVVDALASGEAERVLAVVAELADRSADFGALLEDLLSALHDMAVAHAVGRGGEPPFDAQTVQLLYQIALLGYRDLSIAPDARCAVEMTLLRMLAFAPDDASRSVPPLGAAGSSAAGSATTEDTRSETEPAGESGGAAEPRIAAPDPTAASAVVDADWLELLDALDVKGVARMLLEHSVPRVRTEDRLELVLDPAHDTLLGSGALGSIERALAEHFGRALTVDITPGSLPTETPAQYRARLARQRQLEAKRLLEGDETVQTLVSAFEGRLDAVEPLEVSAGEPLNPTGSGNAVQIRNGGSQE